MRTNIIRPAEFMQSPQFPVLPAARSHPVKHVPARSGPRFQRPADHWLTLGELDGRPTIKIHSRSQCVALPAGTPAPDFTICGTHDHWLTLGEFRGRPVILAFLANDEAGESDGLVANLNDMLPRFQEFDAAVFGLSIQAVLNASGTAPRHHVAFPQLVDCAPVGGVSRSYGVYRDDDVTCENALFLLSPTGKIQWSSVVSAGGYPDVAGLLAALEDLCTRAVAAA